MIIPLENILASAFHINSVHHEKERTILHHGNEYKGEFKNGVKDGKGIMYYKSGYVYEGDWKKGKRDGTCFLRE